MPHFSLNPDLLTEARHILWPRQHLYWIVGGAATGKSTICRAISRAYGIAVYDMDERLYSDYPQHCSATRHPALTAWFTAPDSFAWLLGLTADEFASFNTASTAEILDLLASDLAAMDEDDALLVDGGITNPSVAAQVIPCARMACLAASRAARIQAWEADEARQWMKQMALQLTDGEAAWRRFLRYDELMTETIFAECRSSNIRIFPRAEMTSVPQLAQDIAQHLGIQCMP